MPIPSIPAGNLFMNATTYTGTSSAGTVITNGATGQSFQPDLVWIKNRSTASQHVLTDSVRGTNYQLFSSLTNAEQTSSTGVTSFNTNGFTLGTNVSPTGDTNSSPNAFVGWQWKAGGTAVSNTAGTITSQVSANTTSGFSVVTYTGTGTTATVGHGLGVTPGFVIMKSRSLTGGTPPSNWICWHQSISQAIQTSSTIQLTGYTGAIYLNLTAASGTYGMDAQINGSGQTYVAYCWSEVAGYSKFGSYTGNGSADGPFVYLGFRPRYVMIKRTDSAASWYVYDTARNTYNTMNNWLAPNLSDAENTSTTWEIDIVSNGFKIRNNGAFSNASGGTYIYATFAENPFKYALAR